MEKFQLKKEEILNKLAKNQTIASKTPVSTPTTLENKSFSEAQQLYSLPPDSEVISTTINSFEDNFSSTSDHAIGINKEKVQLKPTTDSPVKSGSVIVKYRALYEFVARSEDELNLQPGDVILVFEGHASEPGWLAGQIKDKMGWFPAAFAEPISAKKV